MGSSQGRNLKEHTNRDRFKVYEPKKGLSHRWNSSGFSTTGTDTGLKKSDRTEPTGLQPGPERPVPVPSMVDLVWFPS